MVFSQVVSQQWLFFFFIVLIYRVPFFRLRIPLIFRFIAKTDPVFRFTGTWTEPEWNTMYRVLPSLAGIYRFVLS